jgi:hypothetical protein
MGLHNKYPSEFYKRGNLFNTYLGSGEESVKLPARKTSSETRARKREVPKHSRQLTAREALNAFVQRNMTLEEMEAWRQRVGDALDVEVTPVPHVGMAYSEIAAFINASIPSATCARYLHELKRRAENGLPLVRS